MNENNKKNKTINLIDWIKKDWYVIVVLIFALFACIYTLNNTNKYINECNEHWQEQVDIILEQCGMNMNSYPGLNNFNISIGGLDGN